MSLHFAVNVPSGNCIRMLPVALVLHFTVNVPSRNCVSISYTISYTGFIAYEYLFILPISSVPPP